MLISSAPYGASWILLVISLTGSVHMVAKVVEPIDQMVLVLVPRLALSFPILFWF